MGFIGKPEGEGINTEFEFEPLTHSTDRKTGLIRIGKGGTGSSQKWRRKRVRGEGCSWI